MSTLTAEYVDQASERKRFERDRRKAERKHRWGMRRGAVARWWRSNRIKLMPAVGLAHIAFGVGLWSVPLGFIVAGIGWFVMEWRVSQ